MALRICSPASISDTTIASSNRMFQFLIPNHVLEIVMNIVVVSDIADTVPSLVVEADIKK